MWNEACIADSSTNFHQVTNNNNPVNTVANGQLFYLILAFLSLVIIGIISPVFIIKRHCKIIMNDFMTYHDVILSTGMRVVSAIFIILKLSFLVASLIIINNFLTTTKTIEHLACAIATPSPT